MQLKLINKNGEQQINIPVHRVYCAGYAGRNQAKVKEHIDELAKIGVPAPARTPAVYPVSTCLFTNNATIEVQREKTSGEVEFVLFIQGNDIFVTVGSDHTDRDLETSNIEKSKQMCEKPVGNVVWNYEEVKEHWDSLILRSWITDENGKHLYQEGAVTALLPVPELLSVIKREVTGSVEGAVIYSGTVPTHGSFQYAKKWDLELEDPVLGRKITHSYDVVVLGEEMAD